MSSTSHALQEHEVLHYDPGFTSTASCESKITYIDGDEGVLLHRGYPIDQLAEHATSSKCATCCSMANCRTRPEEDFDHRVTHHTMVHEQMSASSRLSAAMPIPWPSCAAASARCRPFYHDSTDITDPHHACRQPAHDRQDADACRDGLQISRRPAFVYPKNDLDYASNFLRMLLRRALRGICRQSGSSPRHGPVSSSCTPITSRTRRLRPSVSPALRALTFACIAAVSPASGARPGGANEAALNMLREIGTVDKDPRNMSPRPRTRTIRSA